MDPPGTVPQTGIDMPPETPREQEIQPQHIPSSSSSLQIDSGNRHLHLLRAVMECNSREVAKLLAHDVSLVRAAISVKSKTALHVAVTGNRENDPAMVKQLVELMSEEDLELAKDDDGRTVLHEAAIAGNLEAAELLVKKNPRLKLVKDKEGHVPLYSAAQYGQKEMFEFLLTEIKEGDEPETNIFADYDTGDDILRLLIVAGLYDIALQVIHHYPKIGYGEKSENESENADAKGKRNVDSDENASADRDARVERDSLLVLLAKQNLTINYWSRFLYSCIIVKYEEIPFEGKKVSQPEKHECSDVSYPKFESRFSLLEFEIPKFFKREGTIAYLKMQQFSALELARCICKKSEGLHFSQVSKTIAEAIHMGIKHGNYDFVRVILEKNPFAIWFSFQFSDEEEELNALQAAVMYRQEKIYNLLYEKLGNPKSLASQNRGKGGNNILHLAAKLAPSDQINTISGAALQMQREIQWFKEVETIARPSFKDECNVDGKTPIVMFNEEHKELVKEGENWIKGIANFCTVIATLIATVSFAAQITVPGGNNGNDGLPIFLGTSSDKTAFLIFAILNAVSLVSSTASVGVFLSIITARCAPFDFLFYLPARLILGLLSLFASLVCMLAAFSIILFLVLDIHGFVWAASICGAVFLVATGVLVISHYGLLMDTIICTYGRGMFYRGSKRKTFQF